MGILLTLGMNSIGAKGARQYPLGYILCFFVALISKMLASNVSVHKASLGDSIWAILLGCVVRNSIAYWKPNAPIPLFIKVAMQTELYIATSLVLLCIDINQLRPLAPRALFVSWLDTPSLFMVVAYLGWRFLKIDMQTSIILSGSTFICGSSAAIALGASMGVMHKTEMPIAVISIFTIPSIIALPYVAKAIPFSDDVSGAWFGGCVDSTGAVIASARIYGGDTAINSAAVVKMMQNVLIGPISVVMAWAWSRHELKQAYKRKDELLRRGPGTASDDIGMEEVSAESKVTRTDAEPPKQPKPWVLLWQRFPKFVLGFIITAVLFNTVVSSDKDTRLHVYDYCFYVSEWFSTLSFVSIGLGLDINTVKNNLRHVGKLCTLYVIAQMIDIVATAGLAYVAFTYL
ncbi:hypothetical protein DFQ28_000238 [Apophysomyces sp. BC1034]|nr:hypothetical protein DFQ28_000238 [Apophysomyces sp. BC1034]